MESTSDQVGLYDLQMDGHVGDHEFSPSFTTTEDSSGISSDLFFQPMFSNEFVKFPISNDELQSMENIAHDMEGFEPILNQIEDICSWLGESEGEASFPSQLSVEGEDVWSPGLSMKSSEASTVIPSENLSLVLPADDMEIDNQLSIHHLLQAYGEAMEMEQRELMEVIAKSIGEKINPIGETLERLAFNLFQSTEKEGDYLKEESSKNFEAAFMAFYQIFPYGRFAHFAANSAILEAIPGDAETVHIVDFDMGEGIQWPPMIETLGRLGKAVRLTSIKSWEEDYSCSPSQWRFEETRKRLCDHARSFGSQLRVEEMGIEDLVSEIKKMKTRGGGREWLAFNCMVGLPHMGRRRSRSHVTDFLRVAKELLANSATTGVIAIGDGDAAERLKNCSGYSSFFNGNVTYYQALCESMEWNFPIHLADARTAIESLFVAPYVSNLSWFQKWEETREFSDLQTGVGLEGRRLSMANLMEAKEIVKGESSYKVKIEGQNANEMVLEWSGTPLVRVSTWI
ncbi:protein NODULATION SIGNALING PATHWAY 2-like [Cornus florida]|uniref:protein NODULATION SIGNALING PATHWAY 2-like n=1 Tax=Cornus florida TaxID=4283 RepID=UPI00289AFB34|nr:protein NODULATION SIGNALING PATHWAY 2-like [Cornus florida]